MIDITLAKRPARLPAGRHAGKSLSARNFHGDKGGAIHPRGGNKMPGAVHNNKTQRGTMFLRQPHRRIKHLAGLLVADQSQAIGVRFFRRHRHFPFFFEVKNSSSYFMAARKVDVLLSRKTRTVASRPGKAMAE
ncbi:hypothetical protein D9M69_611700 [compost metagenome]